MSSPLLSVIIPTHRRPEILRQCLMHLAAQTIAKDLEVIVVSDGEDANTVALFQDPTNYSLLTTHYLSIPKSQQGVARNRGVERATAPLVLFIGDDIFLAPDACEKHVRRHAGLRTKDLGQFPTHYPLPTTHSAAVLGYVTWDPAVGITPVMRWLEQSGWQFGYPMIERYAEKTLPTSIQHRFTYTSHISLPTSIARALPFREDVSLYGWEDIEWGIRLRDHGVRLFYEPAARALHHHHISLETSLARMETLGRSATIMERLLPEFDRVPKGSKRLALRMLSLLPTMAGMHRKAFLNGLKAK